MDHGEYGKRIGQLEKEVEKLHKDNDELRKTNFKNAEVAMKKEFVLKNLVETLRKEIDELRSTDLIKNLEKENNDLKLTVEDLRSDKGALKISLDYNDKENAEVIDHYKTECKNLQLQVDNLLKCDECDEKFNHKSDMKTHMLSYHTEASYKCESCGSNSNTEGDVNMHVNKKHSQSQKSSVLKTHNDLVSMIAEQKIKIYNDLIVLKQKEEKEKGKCQCLGSLCKINHSRFRWKITKSNVLYEELRSLSNYVSVKENIVSKSFPCPECEKTFNEKHNVIEHINTEHTNNFNCQCCDDTFNSDSILMRHKAIYHEKNLCQFCDKTIENEETPISHVKIHHTSSVLESTFFNPSAVK